MKNCPFCGEEIQDVAKKCRHCGEWLNLIQCPICGESISANSTVCKFCNENIIESQEPQQEKTIEEPKRIKNIKDTGNHQVNQIKAQNFEDTLDIKLGAPKNPEPKRNFLVKIRKDYSTLIIIIAVIIIFCNWPSTGNNNSNADVSSLTTLNDVLSKDSKSFEVTSNSKEYSGATNQLKIEESTGGYLLKNNDYSCFISSDKIAQFVSNARDGKNITSDICSPLLSDINNEDKSAFVVIDNTYAYDEYGNLDSKGPDNRIKNLQKWLNDYKDSNLDLSLGFLYTTKPEGTPETVNENIIRFRIANTVSDVNIKVLKDEDSDIQFNNRKLYYYKMSFVLDDKVEDCIESSSALYNYDCRNVGALYNKITNIYKTTYQKGSHSGNAMIEYFSSPNIKPLLKSNDKVYIFTDGQFELTENQESLKRLGKQMVNYNSDFLISNFSLSSYSKYPSQFENFWDNKVFTKNNFSNFDCSDSEIMIIGLVGNNPEFSTYARNFYENKMFTGCTVNFFNLY